MTANPALRTLVFAGYFDLAAPYFGTPNLISQLHISGDVRKESAGRSFPRPMTSSPMTKLVMPCIINRRSRSAVNDSGRSVPVTVPIGRHGKLRTKYAVTSFTF